MANISIKFPTTEAYNLATLIIGPDVTLVIDAQNRVQSCDVHTAAGNAWMHYAPIPIGRHMQDVVASCRQLTVQTIIVGDKISPIEVL